MRALIAIILTLLCQAQENSAPKRGGIEGRVLHSKDGQPVRKALVILRRGPEQGSGVYTGAEGNFRFSDIEPGAYLLTAEGNGFVAEADSERKVVTVSAGQVESDVTLKLLKTGTVSGRVVDGDGDPVVNAGIQLIPIRPKKGAQGPSGFGATNDLGEYRCFQVRPGKYRVVVNKGRSAPAKLLSNETYAPTYFPGTADKRMAGIVDVAAGAEVTGIDIQLKQASGVRVRGTIRGAAGAIVMVSMSPTGEPGGRSYDDVIRDANNHWEFTQVLPGTYIVSAIAPLMEDKGLGASKTVEVGEADVDGLELTLASPQNVVGRVVVPEGRELPEGLLVALMPTATRNVQGGNTIKQLDATGKFQMQAVPPGDYDLLLESTGPGNDLYVSEIRAGDEDALNGIHVGDGPVAPIQVKLKANGGAVEIKVKDADDHPVPEAKVTLVPEGERRKQLALYGQCDTDATGTCTVLGMTPGSYQAFAASKEKRIDFRNAEAFKEVESLGKLLQIREGDRKTLELTVIPEEK